jgi:hypothetical protein
MYVIMKTPIFIAIAALTLIAGADKPQSTPAIKAQRTYEDSVRVADIDHQQSLMAARDKYLKQLKEASDSALEANDLNAANEIEAARKAIARKKAFVAPTFQLAIDAQRTHEDSVQAANEQHLDAVKQAEEIYQKEMQLGLDAAIANKDLMEANRIDAAMKEMQRKIDARDSTDSLAQSHSLKSGDVWNGLGMPIKGPGFKAEVGEITIKIAADNETGFQGTYEWVCSTNAGRVNHGSHEMSGQQLHGKVSWIGDNSSHGTLENSVMMLDSEHGEYFAEFWLIPETDVMGRDEVAGTYTVTEHGKGSFKLALNPDGTARKSHVPRVLGRWLGSKAQERILICWTDGWRDMLTKEDGGWKKQAFPPGVSLAEKSVNPGVVSKAN